MDDWIMGACDQVDTLAARDPFDQGLSIQRTRVVPRYLQLLNSLPEAEQEILTEYEYLTSEMAYQRTQIAYQLGRGMRKQHA